MRIQHNITALNAHRNLTNNNTSVGKNLEKLSSGFRINRAGDDAAGLAISEKMRAQITGLQTAQKNAEDGVSLVQTAEGALTEVHSMLNRMVELSTQSANGTYSENNRKEMQKEIVALRSEVDRISDTSNFNGTKLFGGSNPTAKVFDATGKIGVKDIPGTAQVASNAKYEGDWTKATGGGDKKFTITVTGEDKVEHEIELTVKEEDLKDEGKLQKFLNDEGTLAAYGITVSCTGGKLTFTSDDAGRDVARVTDVQFEGTAAGAGGQLQNGALTDGKDAGNAYNLTGWDEKSSITINGKEYTGLKTTTELKDALEADGIELVDQDAVAAGTSVMFKEKATADKSVKVSLHVGESSDDANTIEVNIKAMSAKTLGIDAIDITTVGGAKKAIDTVNAAIDTVSSIRSDLGALQNRLEHTINNIGVQAENITAAESRIRDVDMAKEMMAYTKNNILVQASQAMLAQANQVPQGVLQLLQ